MKRAGQPVVHREQTYAETLDSKHPPAHFKVEVPGGDDKRSDGGDGDFFLACFLKIQTLPDNFLAVMIMITVINYLCWINHRVSFNMIYTDFERMIIVMVSKYTIVISFIGLI